MKRDQLVRLLGQEFLAYVLALDTMEFFNEATLTDRQDGIVDWLERRFQEVVGSSGQFGIVQYHHATKLSEYQDVAATSLVNALRVQAGGSLPEVGQEPNDEVLDALARIARDVWPCYLLPPPAEMSRAHALLSPVGIYQHPAAQQLWPAILQDDALSRLFPQADPDSSLRPMSQLVP